MLTSRTLPTESATPTVQSLATRNHVDGLLQLLHLLLVVLFAKIGH